MVIIKDNRILARCAQQGIDPLAPIKDVVAQTRTIQVGDFARAGNARAANIVGAIGICAGMVMFKFQDVIAGTARNGIAAIAAAQRIVPIAPGNNVIAVATIKGIVTVTAIQRVRPITAIQAVVTGTAIQRIGAFAAAKAVIAIAAIQAVIPGITAQRVVSVTPAQGIIARTGIDAVIATAAAKGVIPLGRGVFHPVKGPCIQIIQGHTGQRYRSALRQGNHGIASTIFTQIGLQRRPA